MENERKIAVAVNMVKKVMPRAIIVDAATVKNGTVVFSVDNQPLLCSDNGQVRGLNGNVTEDAEIIESAQRVIKL